MHAHQNTHAGGENRKQKYFKKAVSQMAIILKLDFVMAPRLLVAGLVSCSCLSIHPAIHSMNTPHLLSGGSTVVQTYTVVLVIVCRLV